MQGANHAPILRNETFASLSPRNAETRLMTSTFRGRFAQSGFARERNRSSPALGIVLGLVGPLFWPYAYDDFIDYTFSPYAYDTFWPYAYDDLFEGIYGAYSPEPTQMPMRTRACQHRARLMPMRRDHRGVGDCGSDAWHFADLLELRRRASPISRLNELPTG